MKTNQISNTRNGHWSKKQKDRFLKGLQKYGKKWKLVQKQVGTRTVSQVRSHAQKHFLSINKGMIDEYSQYSSQIMYDESSHSQISESLIQEEQKQIMKKNQQYQKQIKLKSSIHKNRNEGNLAESILSLCQIQSQSTDIRRQNCSNSEQSINLSPPKNFISLINLQEIQQYVHKQHNPSQFMIILAQNYEKLANIINIFQQP